MSNQFLVQLMNCRNYECSGDRWPGIAFLSIGGRDIMESLNMTIDRDTVEGVDVDQPGGGRMAGWFCFKVTVSSVPLTTCPTGQ